MAKSVDNTPAIYDPLVDTSPPSYLNHPDSYWAQPEKAFTYPSITTDVQSDIVIIGGGYTGLSCAYQLAKIYQLDCTVIEANQPGWGCSGRNGGFVLPGTGRLSIAAMRRKWGYTVSQAVYRDYLDSIDLVSDFIDSGIACEKVTGGYLKLAHQANLVDALHQQADTLSADYGDSILKLTGEQIKSDYLAGAKAFGGIFYPQAYGINPWLLCQGLAKQASNVGATIYGNSPVTGCRKVDGQHVIETEHGSIRAKTLILATNAYGQRHLIPSLADKLFPVISSIIVTEPLNQQQLAAVGMRDGLMVMDTRPLKYYYRILPDKRLLFGGRGAIKGRDANKPAYRNALLEGVQQTFPMLQGVKVSQFWSGWVGVSLDDYPRIYHDKAENILYSGGYCGAGLAFSIQAGKRLAQLLVEPDSLPDLPYWQSPLKRFPFASLRRPALQGFYAWQGLKRKAGI